MGKPDVDYLSFIETSYSLTNDDSSWLAELCTMARPFFDSGHGVLGFVYDLRPNRERMSSLVGASLADGLLEVARSMILSCPLDELRAYCGTELNCGTGSQRFRQVSMSYQQRFARFGTTSGLRDAVYATVPLEPNRGIMLAGYSSTAASVRTKTIRPMKRILCHMGLGLRLRSYLKRFSVSRRPDAILSPTGRLAHAEAPATSSAARSALREAVLRIERARARRRHSDPEEGVELWRGLVSGNWSLIDLFDSDGRRYVFAYRNAPIARSAPALGRRERQVFELAARGYSNKLMAYELGLCVTTISTYLNSARRKLGCRSRLELVSLGQSLQTEPASDDEAAEESN